MQIEGKNGGGQERHFFQQHINTCSNQIPLLRLIHSVGIYSVGRHGAITKMKEKKKDFSTSSLHV